MNKRIAYFAGLAAVVAGGALAGTAYLWRTWRRARPISFEFEGETFMRHSDGRFTRPDGAPVAGPHFQAVQTHWESLRGR
jgi:hypothetical protein